MRAPLSWLRDHADLPRAPAREVAARLVALGFEVESVVPAGADVSGPLVIGRVLSFQEFTAGNGKTVRWVQVRVSADGEVRGVICGALNFAEGDAVVVALPGTVLPGGFEIGARK